MKSKRIAIIAPTGMLGSGVYKVLKDKYKLILVYRNKDKLKLLDKRYGGVKQHSLVEYDIRTIYQDFKNGFPNQHQPPSLLKLFKNIGRVDGIINCAGIINRHIDKDISFSFFMNSALPFLLSHYYQEKLIHITTDCVFSGQKDYPYSELSLPSPTDIYGLSKMLGEPSEKSLVLRTSIIGREISGFSSLLEWFLQQNNKTVKGFTKHFWNGITTIEFGKICTQIFDHREDYPRHGLFHIFSTTLSKYEMLLRFQKKYNINCTIVPDDSSSCNRTLTTIYDLNDRLQIPSFNEMLREL